MKNVKYANKLKRTMVIIGCHTRWDVATKATVVEYILTNGIDAKNGSLKDKYKDIAAEYNVNFQSIHNWVKQYRYTYATAKKAPKGSVVYSPLIVKNGDENRVLKTLNKLHSKLAKLRKVVEHAPGATVDAETLRSVLQSVQEELSEASIKSE